MSPYRKARFDLIAFAVLSALCFLFFNHHDLLETIRGSLTYQSGHFLDFYQYNEVHSIPVPYLPITYLVFAIWTLPLRILGFLNESLSYPVLTTLWSKLLTTGAYLGTGVYLLKIGRALKLDRERSILLAILFLTSPLAFYSQFIFGQYDSFTVFFMALGYWHYLEKRILPFAAFFGLAASFKYFPLICVVPMLLLVEKRPLHLLEALASCLAPLLAVSLPYLRSGAFWHQILGFEAGGRALKSSMSLGGWSFSGFIFLWGVVCVGAYLYEAESDEDRLNWSTYLPTLSLLALFLCILWHPQWLMILILPWAVTLIRTSNLRAFLLLEIALMWLFVVISIHFWADGVDQAMWRGGILGSLNPEIGDPKLSHKMWKMLFFRPGDFSQWVALLNALLASFAVFKFPLLGGGKFLPPRSAQGWSELRTPILARLYLGVGIFVLPAIYVYLATLTHWG